MKVGDIVYDNGPDERYVIAHHVGDYAVLRWTGPSHAPYELYMKYDGPNPTIEINGQGWMYEGVNGATANEVISRIPKQEYQHFL